MLSPHFRRMSLSNPRYRADEISNVAQIYAIPTRGRMSEPALFQEVREKRDCAYKVIAQAGPPPPRISDTGP